MKTKKLKSLNEFISELPKESQERVKSIKQYYDALYALRERRTELGLTQNDLAKLTGLPRPTVSKIESGKRNIRLENLFKIFNALNIKFKIEY